MRLTGRLKAADNISVGVEDADRRYICSREPLLAARFTQERGGREY